MRRTKEAIEEYLLRKFPKCEGDLGRLRTAVACYKEQHPEKLRNISTFELYYGLTADGHVPNKEIARRLGIHPSTAGQLREKVKRALSWRRNPKFWEVSSAK